MPKLLDTTALGQGVQAAKDYTDQRISGVELSVQQATAEDVQEILDDIFWPITYVTFDSDEPRTITPSYTNTGVTLQYSLDKKTWIDIASKAVTPSAKTIYMRGQATGTKSLFSDDDGSNRWSFSGDETNKLRVTGNLNFLLCDTLGDTVAPAAIGEHCYSYMFFGCTSLTTAPELPASGLARFCYYSMFYYCTSLTIAPELPATTIYGYCYNCMFFGCTSLVTAPELPATTLIDVCYYGMFLGCTSLISAKIHATAGLSAHHALPNMLNSVSSSGTLYCKPELTEALLSTPSGWTRVNF